MTKKFATTRITNELKGSAWFRQPQKAAPPPPKSAELASTKASNRRSSVRSVPKNAPVNRTKGSSVQSVQPYEPFISTNSSSVQHTKKTRTIRRAYDLYDHQLTGLRRIRATRELTRDEQVSFSELVRDAIDLLLVKEGIK
jgi:hypothetical protein